MTEAEFQARTVAALTASGNFVLRVSDRSDARRHRYGLHIVGGPQVHATGPDLLVLPDRVKCFKLTSVDSVLALAYRDEPFFIELKRPGAPKRKDQKAQEEWVRIICGGYAECR